MMQSRKSFVSANSFNVYLNIATGMWMSNLSEIFPRPLIKEALHLFSFISDLFIILDLLTMSIPLFSSTVPIEERCIGTFIAIITTQSILKSWHFTLYRKEIQAFMDHWEDSFTGGPFKKEEEQLLIEERRFVKMLSYGFVGLMAFPPFGWCLSSFVPFVQDLHGGRFLPIPSYFPYETLTSPMFEFTVLFQTVSAWFVVSKSVAFDLYFYTLASLVVVHLKYLNVRMENLFRRSAEISVHADLEVDKEREIPSSPRLMGHSSPDRSNALALDLERLKSHSHSRGQHMAAVPGRSSDAVVYEREKDEREINRNYEAEETLREELKLWITHHQQVISLFNELDKLYSPILLVQLLTTILILCFSAFVAKEVTTLDIWQYQSASINVLGHMAVMFLWCYYGDRVAEESKLLSFAGLANGWENCRDKQVVNSIKIIAQRTQIPLQFSAMGLFPLTAETFREVNRLAISYLLVLIDLKDKT